MDEDFKDTLRDRLSNLKDSVGGIRVSISFLNEKEKDTATILLEHIENEIDKISEEIKNYDSYWSNSSVSC